MRAKILSEGETVGTERSRLFASLYALLGKQNAATHELYSDTADLCARPEFQEGATHQRVQTQVQNGADAVRTADQPENRAELPGRRERHSAPTERVVR